MIANSKIYMYHAQQKLHCISSSYIYILILHQTEDRSDGLAKPAENIARRKQSIANSAIPNMPAL